MPAILLHFSVPAYLLTCLGTCIFLDPPVRDLASAVVRMLSTAAWFVPAFAVLTTLAAGAGAVFDRSRDDRPDPAASAREQVARARALLVPLHDERIMRALAHIEAMTCDWNDGRQQRVAGDLASAARTFATAVNSATPERRPAVLELAAESVERLGTALDELDDERRRLDEGDALTIAGYVQARYTSSSR